VVRALRTVRALPERGHAAGRMRELRNRGTFSAGTYAALTDALDYGALNSLMRG